MRLVIASIAILGLLACGDDGGNDNPDAGDGDGDGDGDASTDAAPPPDPRLMYVSTGNAQTLAVVRLESDGTMTALTAMDVDIAANTGAMAYARTAKRLFIGAAGGITTLALDDAGTPTIVGATPNTGNPVYISLTNNDEHMVTAYFGLDSLATHTVTGDPPHNEVELLSTDDQPHAAFIGPAGRIYVPHRAGDTTHWYDIDATGNMTFVDELEATAGVGPRHIVFTPDDAFAYIVNEIGDSVTSHTVAADGSLTAFQTITTIPNDFVDTNNCADIHVTPDGKFVYASNRGHNSIAMFSVGGDGNLAPLGFAATEDTPREFDVSPDGAYVVVAGQGSGFLQSYKVEADGTLTALTTGTGTGRLMVGGDPRWVIID